MPKLGTQRGLRWWQAFLGRAKDNPDSTHRVADYNNADYAALVLKHEGSEQHMYLDGRDNVTVGVGHLCATSAEAARLPFVHASFNRPASEGEICFGWACLKYQSPNLSKKIRTYAKLVLEQEDVAVLLQSDLIDVLNKTRLMFPDFDGFPAPARQAIVDMVFNLGGLQAFPLLKDAIEHQDWNAAAAQCIRRGIGQQRNLDTQQLFLSAGGPCHPA